MKKITLYIFIFTWFIFLSCSISAQQIYFVENIGDALRSGNYNGTGNTLLSNSAIGMYDVAVDKQNSKIYFTNVVENRIRTSNLDGSGFVEILNAGDDNVNGPRGIAVDPQNNHIYWVEAGSGKIRRANLSGGSVTDLITNLSSPVDVALDLINNKIYWSDNGLGAKYISRCNLDGSFQETVVSGLTQVGSIALNVKTGKLFWVEFDSTPKVRSSNLNGSNQSIFLFLSSGSPRGLAIDNNNNMLFWTDVKNGRLMKTSLTNPSGSTVFSNLNYPIGVDVNWDSAVPVELTTFSGKSVNSSIQLSWETATEQENFGFEVERRVKDNWENIGFVEGSGNSNKPNHYQFIDSKLSNCNSALYRLKQIDTDGSFKFSNEIEVELIVENFVLKQNYPNPFNPSTTIEFQIADEGEYSLRVFNSLGEMVTVMANQNFEPGKYSYNFNAKDFSSGVYYYKLVGDKINFTKKMLLLK